MNEKTDKFLQLYKKLEYDGKKKFFPTAKENENIISRLIAKQPLKKYREDLEYCRVVRNFITHNPKVKGVYPIIPSDEMINLLEECIEIINDPPKAIDFAVPDYKIYCAGLNDRVIDTHRIMNENAYTHIPVTENGELIGIFSDNTVYSYLCNQKVLSIDDTTTLRLFEEYIHPDEHLLEYFEFVPEDTLFSEVEELFKYNYKTKRKKLLGAVFITKNGKRTERILGMLTMWDMLCD